ncbi:hypothetical protein [Pseudomonas sp.]|uniref:hypothetical protein n=1 Tax=Pseudomonas sp. TaxID=306 RepID=UPI0028A64E09|nr:hypothetical protein [Pseudomonas sp.]
MTQATSVHSNAFNFMSFIQGGVDPRTGQYTVAIDLPELKANDLQGPGFALRLAFNPLNLVDSGFGRGWDLKLSQYTPHNQVLALSTGEAFRVNDTDREDRRLFMPEQKLASFHVYKVGEQPLSGITQLRVVHRSGLVEILERMQVGNTWIALPVEIRSALGHHVKLRYSDFNQAYKLLEWVDDAQGNPLLRLVRTSTQVAIQEYPYEGDGGEPLAKFVMHLGSDNRVDALALPTSNQASWRYEYGFEDYMYITRVKTPTGAQEDLYYEDEGHRFPSSARRPNLPRVTRHVTRPRFDQPEMEVSYSYQSDAPGGWGKRNFLGDDSVAWHEDDGQDNLYRYNGRYYYGSIQQHWVDGKVVRTIERQFNRFHLLVSEVTRQGDAVSETLQDYGGDEEQPFENQPPNFQLVTKERRRWRDAGGVRTPRMEEVNSVYDNDGNLTERTLATGVREESLWYPPEGEGEDCPPDPFGFRRHLKQKTVRPAQADGQAPVLRQHYTYKLCPNLDDPLYDPSDPDHAWRGAGVHMVEDEKLYEGEDTLLEATHFEYYQTPADAFEHGRLQSQKSAHGNEQTPPITTTTFTYCIENDSRAGETVLKTVQTLTGFDGESKVITLHHSILLDQPLLNRDDNDVEIRYEYDALRRVTRETVAPGKDSEASRRYQYFLCGNDYEQAHQWAFDVKQVKTATHFDGLNRAIHEERDDVDSKVFAGAPRPIYRAAYDGLGQLVEETEVDWLGERFLELKSTYQYDDWGEQCCVIGPDGVQTHEQMDPIGTRESAGPIQFNWRVGDDGTSSGVTETWFNLFEKPTRVERYVEKEDRVREQESLKVLTYDGLGRLLKEIDGKGAKPRINSYEYDAFERLVEHTLPGNVKVVRSFASHSREDLPVSISVNKILLGEQTFDGLDRRTSATTGGRKQTFHYHSGQNQPYEMIVPSGEVVTYEYDLSVGEEPTLRKVAGEPANFGFDKHNARLLDCDVPGQATALTYFSNGDARTETRTVDGQVYAMLYDHSYRSRLRSYTDVTGQVQQYDYNAFGQLEETRLHPEAPSTRTRARVRRMAEDDEVLIRSSFVYDSFGRSESITTCDEQTGNTLKTSLEYDAYEREVLRTFDFGNVVQTLEQCYDEYDCLKWRTLKEDGRELRHETYGYDLRGRLVNYTCRAAESADPEQPDAHYWPVDPYGKKIKGQIFSFDDLDNIKIVVTTFEGGSNRAVYTCGDPAKGEDPAQLKSFTNTHKDYLPKVVNLDYDANGNMVLDEAQRMLKYDALNRLVSVTLPARSANEPGEQVSYHYDAQDVLSGTSGD